jgi:hypothetical protein
MRAAKSTDRGTIFRATPRKLFEAVGIQSRADAKLWIIQTSSGGGTLRRASGLSWPCSWSR